MPRGGKREGAGRKKQPSTAPVQAPAAQTHTEPLAAAEPLSKAVAGTADGVVDNPFHLTPKELLFVVAYCGAANFSATKAYELAGYSMRGAVSTRRVEAIRTLSKPHVQQAVAAKLAARVRDLAVMSGDEALERLTTYARADIGLILGPEDALSKLAPEVRQTIKAVRPTRYGRVIELYDAMRATELLAKAGGKLKDIVKIDSLEEVIAASMQAATEGVSA